MIIYCVLQGRGFWLMAFVSASPNTWARLCVIIPWPAPHPLFVLWRSVLRLGTWSTIERRCSVPRFLLPQRPMQLPPHSGHQHSIWWSWYIFFFFFFFYKVDEPVVYTPQDLPHGSVYSLDNNHSHFVLVEEDPARPGATSEMRVKLLKHISLQRTGYGGKICK